MPEVSLLSIVFSNFNFSISPGIKNITYKIEKHARCLLSIDESLKRALIIAEYSANSEEEGQLIFKANANVELQYDYGQDQIEEEEFIRGTLLPFADEVITQKIRELTGATGNAALDLSTAVEKQE